MVLLASAAGLSSSPMSSWPAGMQSGQKDPFQNPFQNAPGPFIYALPNLAGTCPLSYSDTVLFCSFSGEPNAPDPHHHHHRCCHTSPAVTSRSCHRDPPSESAEEPPKAPTKEAGEPDEELPSPPLARPSAPPLSPSVENHFDLVDDFSSESLTDDGTEPRKQEEGPQASSGLSSSSTQSNSVVSSPTESDFLDGPGPKKEGEKVKMEGRRSELSASTQSNSLPVSSPTRSDCPDGLKKEGEAKKKTRGQRKRRSRKQAKGSEHGVAPRFMGLSGIHYGLWTQYMHLQPPLYLPPPPVSPAMNHHHAWSFAGYPHPSHHYGFVVPPNSPAHQFWNPTVPPMGGFVGVPMQC